jgi:hypothetical protein
MLALSSCAGVSRPSVQPAEPPSEPQAGSQPFVFPAKHSNGEKAGGLTLGSTTVKEAADLFAPFPKGMDEGAPRLDTLKLTVAGRALKLLIIYNPWETMYQLHFDANDRLILLVDGAPELRNKSMNEVLETYPSLKETERKASWFEMQGELQPCVTLIAVFALPDEKLSSTSYAFTCATN